MEAWDPSRLPPELWHAICADALGVRDIVRLARVSRWLYHSAGLLAAVRDLALLHSHGRASATATQRFFAALRRERLRVVALDSALPLLAHLVIESLPALRALESLSLADVPVPALYLSALTRLPALTALHLERVGALPLVSSNVAASRVPPELALDLSRLTRLRSLALIDVALSSDQCAFVAHLTALRELDVRDNSALRSRFLQHLTQLPHLKTLRCSGTQVAHVERFWLHAGHAHEERGKLHRALHCYEEALLARPGDQQALWLRALVLAQLKRPADALNSLDELLEALPRSLPVRLERGRVLRQLKRYRDSIDAFDRVLELDPENLEAWWRKGASYIKIGAFRDAIVCFERAIELRNGVERFMIAQHRPGDAPEHVAFKKDLIEFLRGDAYYDLGDVHTAIACWHRALVFPGEPPAVPTHPRAALATYDRALDLNDTDESVWYTKAMILAALDRHEEAMQCFARAFAVDSTFYAALDRHGESLVRLGRVHEALPLHERVCRELDPMRTRAWVNWATALLLIDEPETALRILAEAREVVGDDDRFVAVEARCHAALHKATPVDATQAQTQAPLLPEER